MEDTLCACYQDALCTSIIQGQAFTCLDDDKRPRVIGNLCTSTPCTTGWYSEVYVTFDEGNQADGLKVHGGYLPSDHFPINKRVEGPNPNQVFLRVCREHDRNFEHWDVHFYQGSFNQLRTKCTKMTMGCVSAEPFQRGSKTSSLTASQK